MESKSKSQTSLGFFGIISESFKTIRRNGRGLGPNIIGVFLTFSLSDFAQNYLLAPFVKDLVLRLAKHTNMVQGFSYTIDKTINAGALKDVQVIVLIKLVSMTSCFFTTLTALVIIILTSSGAYNAKVLDVKDLNLIFMKSWKRAFVTSFYIILLSLGIVFLYLISVTITTVLAVNSLAYLFVGVIALSIPICYVHVSSLWIVSMVVSVLEERFGGVKAIGRAAELLKGNRLQASMMMVLIAIAYGGVHLIDIALMSHNLSMSTQLAIRTPLINGLLALLTLFTSAVYTIFYHEWKTCHGEKEGKGFYIPVAAGDA